MYFKEVPTLLSLSSLKKISPFTANPRWETDPLGEYRWINFDGPLSQLADALWIFGESGRRVSGQILIPDWKLCLAVLRRWNTVTGELDDVKLSILGPVNAPRRNERCSGLEIIAVRLHPEAAAAVLNVRPADIVDCDLALEDWRGLDVVRQLSESGAPANDVGEALVDFLLYKMQRMQGLNTFSMEAAKMVRRSNGLHRITAIADELEIPERTFRRRFEQHVGLSPKHYARRIRLMNMLLYTDRTGTPKWSAVAQDCGYFDQAHMIEDTRLLTGLGPSRLHAMRRDGT